MWVAPAPLRASARLVQHRFAPPESTLAAVLDFKLEVARLATVLQAIMPQAVQELILENAHHAPQRLQLARLETILSDAVERRPETAKNAMHARRGNTGAVHAVGPHLESAAHAHPALRWGRVITTLGAVQGPVTELARNAQAIS